MPSAAMYSQEYHVLGPTGTLVGTMTTNGNRVVITNFDGPSGVTGATGATGATGGTGGTGGTGVGGRGVGPGTVGGVDPGLGVGVVPGVTGIVPGTVTPCRPVVSATNLTLTSSLTL